MWVWCTIWKSGDCEDVSRLQKVGRRRMSTCDTVFQTWFRSSFEETRESSFVKRRCSFADGGVLYDLIEKVAS